MRILFFSHYFPPEVNAPASRTFEHCRHWVRLGHQVTVVTCAPNHPAGKIYPGFRNRPIQKESIDGIQVVRIWTYLAANEGFARRIVNYVSYMVAASVAVPFLPKPDIVVSTSPQFFCGLVGLVAKLVRRVPWVLEVRDVWPESIVTVGAMPRGRVIRTLEALERLAYRRADRIVAVAEGFVPHIAARCRNPPDAKKISVIKNGVDLDMFGRRDGTPGSKQRFGFDETRFVAAYVGTHGMAHGLDTVLDAAAILRDDRRFGFLMVGDGAERARLEARAKSARLDNVRIAGQLPKSDMPAVWSAIDASLILLRKNDTFTKVLPSKMFEAMAMECPIILGVEGEAKALLEQAGGGIAIEPENAEQLAAAMVRLAADPELRKALGRSGAHHVREHYDRTVLAARYIEMLKAAVQPKLGT